MSSIKKVPFQNPKLSSMPKGKIMEKGICDQIQMLIVDWLASIVVIFDSLGQVEKNSSCYMQPEISFAPKGWIIINHFFCPVKCTDGFVILDVPMKEYSYHDNQWFYYSGNKDMKLHFCESRNEIMESWDLTKEEATRVTQELKSWDDECFFKVLVTKEELWKLLN